MAVNVQWKSGRNIILLAVLLVLLFLSWDGPVRAQEKQYPRALTRSMEVFRQSIQSGNVPGIRAILAKGKKILVHFPFLNAIPEYYGAAQAEVMFQRFFESYRTTRFGFVSRNAVLYPDGSLNILAKWDLKERESGKERSVIVFLTFEKEGQVYTVSAFKASQ
jgi:hypothetical protein